MSGRSPVALESLCVAVYGAESPPSTNPAFVSAGIRGQPSAPDLLDRSQSPKERATITHAIEVESVGGTVLTDLVEVLTDDGVTLNGAYFPGSADRTSPADAILWLHGDTTNFYGRLPLAVAQQISASGPAVLSANRRGHDLVSRGAPGGPPLGLAFELVSDSPQDVEVWLELLRDRGHRRVILAGHSGGAVRAIWSQQMRRFEEVVGVVAVSPPDFKHGGLVERYGDKFAKAYRAAVEATDDGSGDDIVRPGVPIPAWWSARIYADTFNEDDRYCASELIGEVPVPVLATFGSEDHPLCLDGHQRLVEGTPANATVELIDGADHSYATRTGELVAVLAGWLPSIG